MRPVAPNVDLPDDVRPVMFRAPEGQEDEINDIPGLVHLDEQGEPKAMEFMFELTDQEIKVLKHEPYITLTVLADHLDPFALQTTFPYDTKYESLEEHTHICDANLAHDENMFWRCDNPSHDKIKARVRECDECFQVRTTASDTITQDTEN